MVSPGKKEQKAIVLVLVVSVCVLAATDASVILRDAADLEGNELGEGSPADLTIDLSHLGPELYGQPDESVGKLVAAFDPSSSSGGNVEELGTYLEGDMLIDRPAGRNGLASTATRWPKGIVPFVIGGNFGKGAFPLDQHQHQQQQQRC